MKRVRHGAGALAAITAAGLLLAACSGATTGSDGAKDQLTLGITADINGWDPTTQAPFQDYPIEAVYDRVVKCTPDGKIIPAIATSWEVSDDKKSFTAHLRKGDSFSDGTPVDAEAIEANYKRLITSSSDRYGGITFKIADPQTITVTWPQPQPLINQRMCNPWIGSTKYVQGSDLNKVPVGSGPYVLDEKHTTQGSVYAFTKNTKFYAAKDYPYAKLQVRVLTQAASLNALRTGQIDGVQIQTSDYEQATKAGLKVIKSVSGVTQWVLADHLGQKIPALGDVRVRQAINMAFDKKAIAEKLFHGLAVPVDQVFRKGNAAYLDGLKDPYPYDIDKAKKLMAEAGYADGFELTIPTLDGQDWLAIVPYVTQQLAELHITLKQKALSGPQAINELLSGDYPAPLFDLTTSSNSVETIGIQVLQAGYWNVEHQPDATIAGYWDTILNGDEAAGAAAQKKLNQYVIDQAWYAPLVAPQNLYAYSGSKVSIPKSSDPNGFGPLLVDFK